MSVATLLIPAVGLAVDGTIMWMIKLKLLAAVDSAALAGARSLSTGVSMSVQKTSAETTAVKYFNANLPAGYWGTSQVTVTALAEETGFKTRTVTVTGTVRSPLYFMQIFGLRSQLIVASGQATRRDANVILVIDRSASLENSGSCVPMKAAAQGFANMFAEQRDYLGLVTFASSSYYMDYPISTTFKSASPSLSSTINKITCIGATDSAAGLWNGYTALANLNQPGALNVIVFFTDGQPTAVTARFPIKGTSPCTSHTSKLGVLTMTTTPTAYGLLNLSNGAVPVANDNVVQTGDNGCKFKTSGATYVATDVASIPNLDYFGNNTRSGYATPVNASLTGSGNTDATSIQNASINAADEAARHIRNGDPVTAVTPGAPAGAVGKSSAGVIIFSIGLGNTADPPNATFLKRVANDPASPTFDPTKPAGEYVFAQTAADLDGAFKKVASEVLRLSK